MSFDSKFTFHWEDTSIFPRVCKFPQTPFIVFIIFITLTFTCLLLYEFWNNTVRLSLFEEQKGNEYEKNLKLGFSRNSHLLKM